MFSFPAADGDGREVHWLLRNVATRQQSRAAADACSVLELGWCIRVKGLRSLLRHNVHGPDVALPRPAVSWASWVLSFINTINNRLSRTSRDTTTTKTDTLTRQ